MKSIVRSSVIAFAWYIVAQHAYGTCAERCWIIDLTWCISADMQTMLAVSFSRMMEVLGNGYGVSTFESCLDYFLRILNASS